MLIVIVVVVCVLTLGDDGSDGTVTRAIKIQGAVSNSNTTGVISDAVVSIGSTAVMTNSYGRYTLQVDLDVSVNEVVMIASHDDFPPQYVHINLTNVFTNQTYNVNRQIELVPFERKVAFNLGDGISFTFDNGYGDTGSCYVSPSSLTNPPTPLWFRFAILTPSTGPGLLRSSVTGNISGSNVLQSSGMYYWDVTTQSDGSESALADDQMPEFMSGSATFSEDIDPLTADDLNFWNMDPLTGVWSDPVVIGTTRRLSDGGEPPSRRLIDSATASARAAGFWNCDRNIRSACVTGYLVMSDGLQCEGVLMKTTSGSNSNGMYSSDLTSSDGKFCLEGASGSSLSIYAGSSRVYTGTFPNSPGMCSNGTCGSVGTLTIPDDTFCGNYDGQCEEECLENEECINGDCVGSGRLAFTLTWANAGDLDLHVTPPCGTEIYYANPMACGGYLDRDDTTGTGPENVFWDNEYSSGSYTVCVVYFQPITTSYSLTVKKSGAAIHSESGSSAACYTYSI